MTVKIVIGTLEPPFNIDTREKYELFLDAG